MFCTLPATFAQSANTFSTRAKEINTCLTNHINEMLSTLERTCMPGFPLIAMRVKTWGNSLVVILPPSLREDMNIHEGDIVAMRVHRPYATFCVWPMTRLAPLGEVDVAALPPLDPVKLRPKPPHG